MLRIASWFSARHSTVLVPEKGFARKDWQRTSFCKRVTPTNSVTWISWIHWSIVFAVFQDVGLWAPANGLELGDLHIFLLSFRGFRGAQFLFDPLAAGHCGCHGTDGLKVFLFGVPICQNGSSQTLKFRSPLRIALIRRLIKSLEIEYRYHLSQPLVSSFLEHHEDLWRTMKGKHGLGCCFKIQHGWTWTETSKQYAAELGLHQHAWPQMQARKEWKHHGQVMTSVHFLQSFVLIFPGHSPLYDVRAVKLETLWRFCCFGSA